MTNTAKNCQDDRCALNTSKNTMMISQNYIDHHLSKLSSSLATFSVGLENQLQKIEETVKSKKTIHENAKQHHYRQAKEFLDEKTEHLRKLNEKILQITNTIIDENNEANYNNVTTNEIIQLPLSDIVTRCQLLLKENENGIVNVKKNYGSYKYDNQQNTIGNIENNDSIFEYTYEDHKVPNDILNSKSNMMNHHKTNFSASTDTSMNTINSNVNMQTPILQSVMEVEEETDDTNNGTTNTDFIKQNHSLSNDSTSSISKTFEVERLHDTPKDGICENSPNQQNNCSWNTTETFSTFSSLPLPGGTVRKARFKKIKASPVKLFHHMSDSTDLSESEKIPFKISFDESKQDVSQTTAEIDTVTISKGSQDIHDESKNLATTINDNDTDECLPGGTVRKKSRNKIDSLNSSSSIDTSVLQHSRMNSLNEVRQSDIIEATATSCTISKDTTEFSLTERIVDNTSLSLSIKNEEENKPYNNESASSFENGPIKYINDNMNSDDPSNNMSETHVDTNSFGIDNDCSLNDSEKENNSIEQQMQISKNERQKRLQVNELSTQKKINTHNTQAKKDLNDDLNVMTKEFFDTPSSKMSMITTSLLVTPEQKKLYQKQVFLDDVHELKSNSMKAKSHPQEINDLNQSQTLSYVGNSSYNAKNKVATIPNNVLSSSKVRASLSHRLNLPDKVRNLFGPTSPLDRIPLTSAWVSKSLNNISCTELIAEWRLEEASSGSSQSADHSSHNKRNEVILDDVTKDEYASAPVVIQMQVTHKEINEGVNLINKHLHVEKNLCNQMEMILSEKMAFNVLGTVYGNKKSKGILMSLCYFEKISMRVMGHEKSFVINI